MNIFCLAIWRGRGCENGGFWFGKCVFYIVNIGLGAILADLMNNMMVDGFCKDFGAILDASGTILASILQLRAPLGGALDFIAFL